jgi:hypothetical protein
MHINKAGMDLRETVEWMYLAQDRDQWLALVNMVMTFRFCKT